MRFARSEDQEMVAEAAREWLGRQPGARALLEGQEPCPGGWDEVVAEQAWPALLAPEELGGLGFDLVALAAVHEEVGRALVPLPLLGTSWAQAAILVNGDDAQRERWLTAIAEGAKGALLLDSGFTVAEDGDGYVLTGTALRVVDSVSADLLVVHTAHGFFVIDGEDAGRQLCPALDPTRELGHLSVNELRVSADRRLAHADVDAVRARCMALLAAECVGVAEAVMDLAVEYAKVREQFRRPIGSFQAIQHICADMLVLVESARSAALYAAWAVDTDHLDALLAARTALATAADAAFTCAGQSIQVHGGIGFTWEHAAHLYFKRARANRTLLGEPKAHRAAVAAHLFDSAPDNGGL